MFQRLPERGQPSGRGPTIGFSPSNCRDEGPIQATGANGRTFIFQESLRVGLIVTARIRYRPLGESLSFRRLPERRQSSGLGPNIGCSSSNYQGEGLIQAIRAIGEDFCLSGESPHRFGCHGENPLQAIRDTQDVVRARAQHRRFSDQLSVLHISYYISLPFYNKSLLLTVSCLICASLIRKRVK